MHVSKFNDSKTVFGRRLRQARLRAGLPQDRLGVLAGLEESSSSARISRYESGVHEPPLKFAEELGKVLKVPMAFLYCNDDRLANIILAYTELSEENRQQLSRLASELAK